MSQSKNLSCRSAGYYYIEETEISQPRTCQLIPIRSLEPANLLAVLPNSIMTRFGNRSCRVGLKYRFVMPKDQALPFHLRGQSPTIAGT
jgi:hypothetical protein